MQKSRTHIALRIVAGIVGSYAFSWGFVALGIVLLLSVGMSYGEARTLVYLLAFLVMLAVFCWSFAARSLARVGVVLAGGGAAMAGAAWLLSPALT
ncbi:MAG: iron uptake protein [Steroidobacteraceae bacterium]